MIRAAFLCFVVALAPMPALAHKVIASVFPSGTQIEGEIGFSDGSVAANQLVDVFNEAGEKLGEVKTDGDGFFVYTPTVEGTHVFRADLGAGHVAEVKMPAGDVADILARGGAVRAGTAAAPASGASLAAGAVRGGTPAATALPAVTAGAIALPATVGLGDDEYLMIARIVRDEMRPLRQEIAAYREKNDLQSILGGIGYIVGLAGVGYYVAARRRLKTGA
ncbi:cobalt ABC transporter permease [Tropicimonas sp.]|uniref:cobalt ABC transporter permease n=1 Tax=Tropicimonas sp. TaxID=2067044 RepID=UPI003A888DE9